MIIDKGAVLVFFLFAWITADALAQEKVRVYRIWQDGEVVVFAKNPNHLPVTVFADIEEIHPESSPGQKTGPVLIRPNSVARIASLGVIDEDLPNPAKVILRTTYGNPFARHSGDIIYRLPSGAENEAIVSQGTGDQRTHSMRDRYAVDFDMALNSPVYAARSGVVALVKENSQSSGFTNLYNEDANYIMVLHSDDTIAVYAHLLKNGSVVEPGQRVDAGHLIGYSGNTGLSHSPHLHFMVMIPELDGSYQTIEIPFATSNGIISQLKTGDRLYSAEIPGDR